MADEPTIRRRKLTDYTPDPNNANAGTERGQYMVETSVEQVGAGRSLVATADGVIAAGNKTLQALVDAGIVDVIEVETDGKTAVVVRRTDWEGIENEQARAYAYFDNRASEAGLAWDAKQVLADIDAGVDLDVMFRGDELDAFLAEVGGVFDASLIDGTPAAAPVGNPVLYISFPDIKMLLEGMRLLTGRKSTGVQAEHSATLRGDDFIELWREVLGGTSDAT